MKFTGGTVLIGAVVALAGYVLLNMLGVGIRGALMGTTTDPGSLGSSVSTSQKPVRGTLRTNAGQTISFEAPAAFFGGVGRKTSIDGEQAASFNVWSRTFDPTAPDIIELRIMCNFPGTVSAKPNCSEFSPPEGSRFAQRKADGEHQIIIQVFNSYREGRRGLELESDSRQIAQARVAETKGLCRISTDPVSGLLVFDVPEHLYPSMEGLVAPAPVLCGGAWGGGPGGQRASSRQQDGSYKPYYSPARTFYELDAEGTPVWGVNCTAANEERILAKLCTMSVRFNGWSGRAVLPYSTRADWRRIQADIQTLLKRFNDAAKANKGWWG